jgi:hypothetical protein
VYRPGVSQPLHAPAIGASVKRWREPVATLALGAFLAAHLVTMTWLAFLGDEAAFAGDQSLMAGLLEGIHQGPVWFVLEGILILLPIWGCGIWELAEQFSTTARERPLLQDPEALIRCLSFFAMLVFIADSVWSLRIMPLSGSLPSSQLHVELCAQLSSTSFGIPFQVSGYLLGLAASVGYWVGSVRRLVPTLAWPATVHQRAAPDTEQGAWRAWALLALAVLAFLVGANNAVQFATGSTLWLG